MIRMPPGSRLCSVFHDLHCSKWFIIIAQLDLGKLSSLSFYLFHFSFQLLCYNYNLNQNESNACHSTFFLKSCFCYEQLLLIDLHVAGEIELSMMFQVCIYKQIQLHQYMVEDYQYALYIITARKYNGLIANISHGLSVSQPSYKPQKLVVYCLNIFLSILLILCEIGFLIICACLRVNVFFIYIHAYVRT